MGTSLVQDKSIHSSEVRLAVEVRGHLYPVCAVGLDRFVLVNSVAFDSETAELIDFQKFLALPDAHRWASAITSQSNRTQK